MEFFPELLLGSSFQSRSDPSFLKISLGECWLFFREAAGVSGVLLDRLRAAQSTQVVQKVLRLISNASALHSNSSTPLLALLLVFPKARFSRVALRHLCSI